MKKAYKRSTTTIEAAKLLIKLSPQRVKKVRSKLEALIKEAEALIKQADASLAKLEAKYEF